MEPSSVLVRLFRSNLSTWSIICLNNIIHLGSIVYPRGYIIYVEPSSVLVRLFICNLSTWSIIYLNNIIDLGFIIYVPSRGYNIYPVSLVRVRLPTLVQPHHGSVIYCILVQLSNYCRIHYPTSFHYSPWFHWVWSWALSPSWSDRRAATQATCQEFANI